MTKKNKRIPALLMALAAAVALSVSAAAVEYSEVMDSIFTAATVQIPEAAAADSDYNAGMALSVVSGDDVWSGYGKVYPTLDVSMQVQGSSLYGVASILFKFDNDVLRLVPYEGNGSAFVSDSAELGYVSLEKEAAFYHVNAEGWDVTEIDGEKSPVIWFASDDTYDYVCLILAQYDTAAYSELTDILSLRLAVLDSSVEIDETVISRASAADMEALGVAKDVVLSMSDGTILSQSELDAPINVSLTAIPEAGVEGSCGDDAAFTLSADGMLTINGTGTVHEEGVSIFEIEALAPYRNLVRKIVVGEGITTIRGACFQSAAFVETVELPSTLEVIGGNAFHDCASLADITLPEGLKSINNGAFAGCSSLTSIEIPSTVTNIEVNAFDGCTSLTGITLPDTWHDTVVEHMTWALHQWDEEYTVRYFYTGEADADIGQKLLAEALEAVGTDDSWFDVTVTAEVIEDTNINIVDLTYDFTYSSPEITKDITGSLSDTVSFTLTADKVLTFSGSGNVVWNGSSAINMPTLLPYRGAIEKIVVEEGITGLGYKAFAFMDSLSEVELPTTLKSLAAGVFEGCPNLTSVALPESIHENTVTWIMWAIHPWKGSYNVRYYYTGDVNESVGGELLAEALALAGTDDSWIDAEITTVLRDDGLVKIADITYKFTYSAPEITEAITGSLSDTVAFTLTADKVLTFSGSGSIGWDGSSAINMPTLLPYRGVIEKIVVEEGITELGVNAFCAMTSLKEVTLPETLLRINRNAFGTCPALTEITIPSSVVRMQANVFQNCAALTTVNLPENQDERAVDAIASAITDGKKSYAFTYFSTEEPGDIAAELLAAAKTAAGASGITDDQIVVKSDTMNQGLFYSTYITYSFDLSSYTVSGTVTGQLGSRGVTVTLTQNGTTVDSLTVYNGEFSFANILPGSYTLTISSRGCVTKTLTVTVADGDVIVSDADSDVITLTAGDIEADGKVDRLDMVLLMTAMFSKGDSEADLNDDGYVDAFDLAILFGKVNGGK